MDSRISRRAFVGFCSAACGAAAWGNQQASAAAPSRSAREFNVCLTSRVLAANPDLLPLVKRAGIDRVWLAGFFYGYWPCRIEDIQTWRKKIQDAGLSAEVVNVPLGHPGDSLGSSTGDFPLTPGKTWRMATRPDGTQYSGTSLHPPATDANCEALKQLQAIGVRKVFLDDDFRLAVGPGVIGGCFCDDHRDRFLKQHGFTSSDWKTLLDDVRARNLSRQLRAWVEFTCDELTGSFRAQQAAAPEIALGNMIMFLGAEKAGIRLADYRDALFRVGEGMFGDSSFGTIEGKTSELFSCLFHRRYARPELAFSESTAFPCNKLSAANMAAKLAISTIADVRNTMFMSGVEPFPLTHWDTLAPAIKKHKAIHEKLAGHTPRGPLKHCWGEYSRYVGADKPFSEFLALGIPFEVVDAAPDDGWTFLSNDDARALNAEAFRAKKTRYVVKSTIATEAPGATRVEATIPAMAALKQEITAKLSGTPYVEGDKPVVCAWYPSCRSVLLWNLSETKQTFALRAGNNSVQVPVAGLDVELIEGIGA